MISYKVSDVKEFMNRLLRQSAFDSWEVREVKLHTRIRYQILGEINPSFYPEEEREELKDRYIPWSELKETVFSIIKGRRQPTLMQITLAYPRERLAEIQAEGASSCLLNIHYENGALSVITAVSMANFTLDKSAEQAWDAYAVRFLAEQGIETETA